MHHDIQHHAFLYSEGAHVFFQNFFVAVKRTPKLSKIEVVWVEFVMWKICGAKTDPAKTFLKWKLESRPY